MALNLPKLEKGKVFLMRAEISTGIILNNDDTYYLSTGENYYKIFNSIMDVKSILINKPTSEGQVEYLIYDHNGSFIELLREGESWS